MSALPARLPAVACRQPQFQLKHSGALPATTLNCAAGCWKIFCTLFSMKKDSMLTLSKAQGQEMPRPLMALHP